MNPWLKSRIFAPKRIGVFLLFFILPTLVIFSADKFTDPDALYHIRHAWIYRTQSLADSSFPWVQFSAIKTAAADLWYGFHILLFPATYGRDLGLNLKIAGAILAGLMLLSFYHLLKKQKISWPLLWTLILYFSSTDFFLRANSSRPQTISFALLALLLAILNSSAVKNNNWRRLLWIGTIGAIAAWIHAAFFWIFIAAMIARFISKVLVKKDFIPSELGALILGQLVGLVSRPNPAGIFDLLRTQLFRLASEKQKVALLFGQDILPLTWAGFIYQLVPFSVLLLTVLFLAWKFRKKPSPNTSPENKIILLESLFMISIFGILTITTARRASDVAVFYGIILAAIIMEKVRQNWRRRRTLFGILLIFLSILAVRHLYTFREHLRSFSAVPADRFKEVALWLKANTAPGTIVFHPVWDSFPSLFFWNQQNYYINGMDPIFEYVFSPRLYWKNHNLAVSGKMYTCETPPPCDPEKSFDILQVIRRDFKSNYVALDLVRNATLARNLAADARASLVIRGSDTALFKIDSE